MKLYSFKIQGFRGHIDTTICFSDSTFLIGENNAGKSSVLKALEYFLQDKKKIELEEFHCKMDSDGNIEQCAQEIILTAEFRNVPEEAKDWQGFRGRLFYYDIPTSHNQATSPANQETGLSFMYRKTYTPNTNYMYEMKSRKSKINPLFSTCRTLQNYIDCGLTAEVLETLPNELQFIDKGKKLSNKEKSLLHAQEDLLEYEEGTEEWIKNPGGFSSIVVSKLPRFILIPAQDKKEEITASTGTLQKTLLEIFNEIKEESENYREAQKFLKKTCIRT